MSQIAYLGVILFSIVGSMIYYFLHDSVSRKQQKVLLVTLVFVFFMEVIGEYTTIRKINNTLLYNLGWIYLESLLIVYYLILFENNRKVKWRIVGLFTIVMIWGVINSLFFQPIYLEFQYYSLLPMGLLILGLCARFFYRVLKLELFSDKDLITVPHLWIIVGIGFFYVEALILFGYLQFMPKMSLDVILTWFSFNRVLAAIMYLLFSLAFYVNSIINNKWKTSEAG